MTSELDEWVAEVHAHREALDAILALTGHDPHNAECYNDPNFGETVRQSVEEALGGAPGCGVRRYLILIEGLLAARAGQVLQQPKRSRARSDHNKNKRDQPSRWPRRLGRVPMR